MFPFEHDHTHEPHDRAVDSEDDVIDIDDQVCFHILSALTPHCRFHGVKWHIVCVF